MTLKNKAKYDWRYVYTSKAVVGILRRPGPGGQSVATSAPLLIHPALVHTPPRRTVIGSTAPTEWACLPAHPGSLRHATPRSLLKLLLISLIVQRFAFCYPLEPVLLTFLSLLARTPPRSSASVGVASHGVVMAANSMSRCTQDTA